MGEEQVDDAVGVERPGVRAQLVVGPDEVSGLAGQQVEEPLQRLPVEGFLEVLDDVELDAALLEDAEGATGLASTRVVVQQQTVAHGDDPRNKPSIRSKWPRPAARLRGAVQVGVGRRYLAAFLSLLACRFSLAVLEAGVFLARSPLSLPAMMASPTFCSLLGATRP